MKVKTIVRKAVNTAKKIMKIQGAIKKMEARGRGGPTGYKSESVKFLKKR